MLRNKKRRLDKGTRRKKEEGGLNRNSLNVPTVQHEIKDEESDVVCVNNDFANSQ